MKKKKNSYRWYVLVLVSDSVVGGIGGGPCFVWLILLRGMDAELVAWKAVGILCFPSPWRHAGESECVWELLEAGLWVGWRQCSCGGDRKTGKGDREDLK